MNKKRDRITDICFKAFAVIAGILVITLLVGTVVLGIYALL